MPLTTFIYPIMFSIIILSCIGLILMGPNRSPESGYLYTLFTPEILGSLCLYMVLGLILHYDYVPIVLLFYLLFMTRSLY
jgi:hypothetical protein